MMNKLTVAIQPADHGRPLVLTTSGFVLSPSCHSDICRLLLTVIKPSDSGINWLLSRGELRELPELTLQNDPETFVAFHQYQTTDQVRTHLAHRQN